MRIAAVFVVGLTLIGVGCKRVDDVVQPVPDPIWAKRTDVILNQKIVLDVQATDKRLVMAFPGGFLQMEQGDTAFVRRNSSGGTIQYLLGGQLSPSLFKPILANRLYVGVASERNAMVFLDVFDTIDSTYNSRVTYFDIDEATRIANAQVHTSRDGPVFGAYNETTRTLLFSLESSRPARRWTAIVNKKENSPHFAFRYTNDPYRTDTVGRFPVRGSIAVRDYFIVSPFEPMLATNSYLYAVDAKQGGLRKIPINFIPPDKYFFYKKRLYGYESTLGKLVRSDDGGFTWRDLGNLGISPLEFTEIRGNLIAYGLSQIFWMDDGSETFANIRELTNAGLDYSRVTGLTAFGNKVYAATLSGLYTIDSKDFFTLRKTGK